MKLFIEISDMEELLTELNSWNELRVEWSYDSGCALWLKYSICIVYIVDAVARIQAADLHGIYGELAMIYLNRHTLSQKVPNNRPSAHNEYKVWHVGNVSTSEERVRGLLKVFHRSIDSHRYS